jgi:hypothetical protein
MIWPGEAYICIQPPEVCHFIHTTSASLSFTKFPLHPDAIHLQLPFPIDQKPAVDTELFDCKQRVWWTVSQRTKEVVVYIRRWTWRGQAESVVRSWVGGVRWRVRGGTGSLWWRGQWRWLVISIFVYNFCYCRCFLSRRGAGSGEDQCKLIWMQNWETRLIEFRSRRTKLKEIDSCLITPDVKIIFKETTGLESQLREIISTIVAK